MVEVKTIQQAVSLSTPSIGSVNRDYGVKKTMAYIKLWILDLCQSVNLKRSLTESQIDEIALLIVTEFNNITLADAYLVFKNAKMGKYGSFYESLDCPKVLTWFTEYLDERMSLAMNNTLTAHNEHKSESRRQEPTGEWMNKLQVDNAKKEEYKKK